MRRLAPGAHGAAKILRFPGLAAAPLPSEGARRERRARLWVLALIVAVLALFWGGVAIDHREAEAGIRALPAAARSSLYERAMGELRSICLDLAAASGDLREHCLEEARFALVFPECDDACRRASALVLPHARR
jgi:hypothetical protein